MSKDYNFETVFVPCVSIKPSGITVYKEFIGRKRIREENDLVSERPEQLKRNGVQKANGVMSIHARRRAQNAIKWLEYLSENKKVWNRDSKSWIKFKLNFITLSLASKQMHTDNEIKAKLFNHLLTELRNQFGMKHYVWRAEKQKNGNIHFHIVTNIFISHIELRKKWNRIQNKLGYVDRYRESMLNEIKEFRDYYDKFIEQGSYNTLMRRYCHGQATEWRSPNSTDIHSLRKIKNIGAYICKYMCKNETNEETVKEMRAKNLLVSGRLWGLSESLSKLKSITTVLTNNIIVEINQIYNHIKKDIFQKEYFTFFKISLKELSSLKCYYLLETIHKRSHLFNECCFCAS